MDVVQKKLGRRVRDLREAAGLSQAELAEKVGVVDETISRLERGSSMPSLGRIQEIASALGTDLSDLFSAPSRDAARDRALERVLQPLRRRKAADIDAIADILGMMLRRWK